MLVSRIAQSGQNLALSRLAIKSLLIQTCHLVFFRAKETHQIAEAAQEKNARLREAFGLGEYYVDGSAFDPDRKAKQEAAKALAMAQKKYRLVRLLFVQATHATGPPYLR